MCITRNGLSHLLLYSLLVDWVQSSKQNSSLSWNHGQRIGWTEHVFPEGHTQETRTEACHCQAVCLLKFPHLLVGIVETWIILRWPPEKQRWRRGCLGYCTERKVECCLLKCMVGVRMDQADPPDGNSYKKSSVFMQLRGVLLKYKDECKVFGTRLIVSRWNLTNIRSKM